MKRVFLLILCLFATSSIFADDFARISIKVTGTADDVTHYLCIYNAGCFSMSAGYAGRLFPVGTGDMANLERIVITDILTRRMYTQPISDSCKVIVEPGKKLVLYGKLDTRYPDALHIDNLRCVVE